MNNQRIIDWIDGLFTGFAQTDTVREQKEELQLHLVERIKEYMASSMDFDQAFAAAKEDLGDLDELLASFEKSGDFIKRTITEVVDDIGYAFGEEKSRGWHFRIDREGLVALSPFIYIILGFAFGWWAWAWIIIPVSAIVLYSGLFSGDGDDFGYGIIALSPFIYLILGFAFNWWAWGWVIIPLAGILFGIPVIRIKRR